METRVYVDIRYQRIDDLTTFHHRSDGDTHDDETQSIYCDTDINTSLHLKRQVAVLPTYRYYCWILC